MDVMALNLSELGIKTQKVNQFNKKGIQTLEDLLYFIPRKYYDFRNPIKIKRIKEETRHPISVIGKISKITVKPKIISLSINDGTESLYVNIFGQNHTEKTIRLAMDNDTEMIFCGVVSFFGKYRSMTPMFFGENIADYQKIIPIYSKIQGMSSEFLTRTIKDALKQMSFPENLSESFIKKENLVSTNEAIRLVHNPSTMDDIEKAKQRLIYDKLYRFNKQLMINQQEDQILLSNNRQSTFNYQTYELLKKLSKNLPFDFTKDQRTTINHLTKNLLSQKPINALIQGDVGCGKTLIALSLMFTSSENGHQSALVCPTNVLAKQHYEEAIRHAMPLCVANKVVLLNGEMKKKEKEEIKKRIKTEDDLIIIGTHSVLQESVEYKNLALVIVDEEHRFGVIQRDFLKNAAKSLINVVNMSATPIPRSLALTVYGGNVDVQTIKSLPFGRKPVATSALNNPEEAYEKIYEEIKKGHQAYVICPLIEDSESEKMIEVNSVEETYTEMINYFKMKDPSVKIKKINGKMKEKEVDDAILQFKNKEAHILVGTTIVEVGVNVPNATMIVIQNAERFGLAQLHQLRGRVGRGIDQSYCYLLTEDTKNQKIQAMVKTTNGFEIAKEDLSIRGPGNLLGTEQSGQNEEILLMLAYPEINERIREEVKKEIGVKNAS
jgi:ATP-dependent DNA helicase RecG